MLHSSPSRRFAFATVVLRAACAPARPHVAAEPEGPSDFAVRNNSSCVARLRAVRPHNANEMSLGDLSPSQSTVVMVPAGFHLSISTIATNDPAPDVPGKDCRGTGQVTWKRVETTR